MLNGEPLSDFVQGQHAAHERLSRAFADGQPLESVAVDRSSRVGPLLVVAVGAVVGITGLVLAAEQQHQTKRKRE